MAEMKIFPEPRIEFRYGQKLYDPHLGLTLFGPFDYGSASHPTNITYGLLGTAKGIELFHKWSKRMRKPIETEEEKKKKLWPAFPGFHEVFGANWPEKAARTHPLDEGKLLHYSHNLDPNKRAFQVVGPYVDGIAILKKFDEAFDIFICVVPDDVWKNCRPKSQVIDGWGDRITKKTLFNRASGQTSLFGSWKVEEYNLSVDFRRQIKARAMKYDVPIQIIRESTLKLTSDTKFGERGLTPLADRAWNLSTAIYYKSGGKPWRLAEAREGVCYIGVSYKRSGKKKDDRTACCAAQMFLDSGDGVIFLGDEGPWYSPREKQYHLSKKSANKLLNGTLKTYKDLGGKKLKEIFLHSRSEISDEEFEGYSEACPPDVKLVAVRVRTDHPVKIFREGKYPVIRGTFWKLNERSAYLWASGFKPSIGTYDGWEVPSPLRIDVQQGDAEIEQVAKDIFSLTKLNYNACKLGDSQPVTIGFSDAVGEILVSNPAIKERNPTFKFYI